MTRIRSIAIGGALLILVVAGSTVHAASTSIATRPQESSGQDTLATWRFPVGERMEYSVTWGGAKIAQSVLMVEAIDSINGTAAYRASLETRGGPPFYRIQDRLTSWIRPTNMTSLRFDQRLRQGSYRRNRRHLMNEEAGTYTRYDARDGQYVKHDEEFDVPIPAGVQDDVSIFYFVRLSPLKVGERYEYDLYYKKKGNPVIIEVLRREEIRVPAGTFKTIVVRPIIKTSGMFSEGGEAEIYVTDDERRIPVRVKTRMSIGSANLYLTDYDPGELGSFIEATSD
jgi:hypothetical protein